MIFLHKRNLLKYGYSRNLINKTMKKVKFSMRAKPKSGENTVESDKRKVGRPAFVT